jgi:hypothetical protein
LWFQDENEQQHQQQQQQHQEKREEIIENLLTSVTENGLCFVVIKSCELR